MLTPPLGHLIGGVDFQALVLQPDNPVVIRYGAFPNNVVNFVNTLFATFLVVRGVTAVQSLRRRETETGETAAALPLLRLLGPPKAAVCWPPKGL